MTILTAALLSACGGGGADTIDSSDNVALAKVTTGNASKPTTTTTLTPVGTPGTPGMPSTPSPPSAPVVGSLITDVKLQNTGAARTNAPVTFGQVFAVGEMAANDGLVGKLADGTVVLLQLDVKATHADGSVRHAIVSGVMPTLAANQTSKLQLFKSTAGAKSSLTPQNLLASGLSSDVTITINNIKYTASLADAVAAGKTISWLSGNIANEWIFEAPLKTSAGVAHPLLTARFDVRWYSGLNKQARVDVVVENAKTFSSGSNLTYDVNVNVGGRSVYAKNALTQYHHSRWRKVAWWDAATEPSVDAHLNIAYLIASKAVSNYDQKVVPSEQILQDLGNQITAANTGPMTIGPVWASMGSAGGRHDIAPLPHWTVSYLLSDDKRARNAMMAAAEGSGTWQIHYRDETTGQPIRTDSEANKNISTHGNMGGTGPLPVPRCAPSDTTRCNTPFVEDAAHEPSLAYVPYLITGDYYYLEELQFWAATNPLQTAPGNNGYGQGLLRWQQVRGQAWSLRTLGHAAYITPDASPMKAYFTKQVDNNLNFYHQTYVVGNPNKLGLYDGSGEASFQINGTSPWQDDYFTWSLGYLAELGFTKATPIFQWKSKYVIGRMTDPGFCWIEASSYFYWFRDSANSPVYDTFAQVYQKTFGEDMRTDNDVQVAKDIGKKFVSLECGSQAQADLLTSINPGFVWEAGRMAGYADSVLGYSANMQPALSMAASSGMPNGQKAWSVFMERKNKPNYNNGPQFAIIPR